MWNKPNEPYRNKNRLWIWNAPSPKPHSHPNNREQLPTVECESPTTNHWQTRQPKLEQATWRLERRVQRGRRLCFFIHPSKRWLYSTVPATLGLFLLYFDFTSYSKWHQFFSLVYLCKPPFIYKYIHRWGC